MTLERSDGAGGTTYSALAFTNRSTSSCGLVGHPEVSFLDSARRVIARAVPMPIEPTAVTLTPGEIAGATIGVVSGCLGAPAVTPASVRVVLAGGGAASVAAGEFRVCSGQNPTIRPFQKVSG